MLNKQFVVIMFVMVTMVLAAQAATASAPMTYKTDETAIFPFTVEITDVARQANRQEAESEAAAIRCAAAARDETRKSVSVPQ
jgi:hypothetical protein